jgi:phage terminase large subunit-like protein
MWDLCMFTLGAGPYPRWLFSSTPKPIKLLRDLLAREGRNVAISRGTTFSNAKNLAPAFLEAIKSRYEGTRIGRQELNAEILGDTSGALWTYDIQSHREAFDAAIRGRRSRRSRPYSP